VSNLLLDDDSTIISSKSTSSSSSNFSNLSTELEYVVQRYQEMLVECESPQRLYLTGCVELDLSLGVKLNSDLRDISLFPDSPFSIHDLCVLLNALRSR
jgi:hypothetical protein